MADKRINDTRRKSTFTGKSTARKKLKQEIAKKNVMPEHTD